MKLVVCEKPSVARSIAAVLGASKKCTGYTEGNGFVVSWCYGHLAGLMYPDDYCEEWKGKWDFSQLPMIPDMWKFKITDSGKEQFKILKKLMNDRNISEIVCATDADREGECIFRYVYMLSGSQKPVKRLWISSLEEEVIKKGFKNLKPEHEYDSIFHAGFCRARADWLVGMNASRLFSCRYGTNLNIGRVQTPTLALIVNRDKAVSEFVKQKYFTVDINALPDFTLSSERIDSESEAENIAVKCNNKNAVVIKTEHKNKTTPPPKLYDLTTLQRDANRILGYSAQQTLEYLQSLYEGKLATYPRTNSQYISDDMRDTALNVIEKITDVFSEFTIVDTPDIGRCINNAKVEGHHAILPTENIASVNLSSLPEGQKNILILISARLICAVSPVHTYKTSCIYVSCENTVFTATGNTVTNNGWKSSYLTMINVLRCKEPEDTKEKNAILPDVNDGHIFNNIKSRKTEHFTSPPKSYTEETLLSAMEHAGQENYDEESEKKGLGTPATRAGIIETLVAKGYISRDKKKLISTEKGRQLVDSVPEEILSARMTAEWEMKLQQIEKNIFSETDFMKDITEFVKRICELYSTKDTSCSANNCLGICPVCGNEITSGKYGFYCKGKCGMQIGKVYGKVLSETNIKNLLSGNTVTLNSNGKKTTIISEVEPFRYTSDKGKEVKGYQWKTERNTNYGK
ncbi:MAG: DNA topoisomerase 3 [Oscillospiraceae bacterium]|nr:DNA topoisomerase 3 [Oscillospiraceae bacterium]